MKKNKGKYDKVLTVFLIVIFIGLIATLGPYFYDEIKSSLATKQALEDFEESTEKNTSQDTSNQIDPEAEEAKGTLEDILNELNSEEDTETASDDNEDETEEEASSSSSSSKKKYTQAVNYSAVGKIEIPKTGISYPIYDQMAKSALESGVVIAYGVGLNQSGNTVIYGHNFRNGKFFSNNKKLSSGDKIYITDSSGNRVEYTIYSIYTTTPTDASYMVRDTAGRREISLQTCTDDSSGRLIIWATAD